MNIVVLGSTGMAGHVIAHYLQEQGYQVYRASRSERNTAMSAAINITDFPVLQKWLDSVRPDVIVNCIGLLQKACDARPDLAVLINAYYPHWLEENFSETDTRIIHLSTDCVFSGSRGGYREGDPADGVTMYDRTKALGELINKKDLTFRMSIIGPDIDPRGTGLFNWFMAQHGDVHGWSNAIWNGVTTIELAHAIDAAISCSLKGLYHLVPNKNINKYSLLQLIQKTFDRTDVNLHRENGPQIDKSLCNTRTDLSYVVQPYEKQIADMKIWVDEHHTLYPHYEY